MRVHQLSMYQPYNKNYQTLNNQKLNNESEKDSCNFTAGGTGKWNFIKKAANWLIGIPVIAIGACLSDDNLKEWVMGAGLAIAILPIGFRYLVQRAQRTG